LERNNLWAPWRIGYIRTLEEKGECFICKNLSSPDRDDDNGVVWRTELSVVVLNRYPYNNGHLLIAPVRHIAGLEEAAEGEMLDLIALVRDSQKVLSAAIRPHGFNVGMNFGRCAGAGLPEHLHIHVVPRWDGDTNFMSACGGTDVISQSLAELLAELRKAGSELGLPASGKFPG
jgi:ATP adenylyltransferase